MRTDTSVYAVSLCGRQVEQADTDSLYVDYQLLARGWWAVRPIGFYRRCRSQIYFQYCDPGCASKLLLLDVFMCVDRRLWVKFDSWRELVEIACSGHIDVDAIDVARRRDSELNCVIVFFKICTE